MPASAVVCDLAYRHDGLPYLSSALAALQEGKLAYMCTDFELILSQTGRLEDGRYPGLRYEEQTFGKFHRFKDVAVPLRDGTTIYIDVYRPLDDTPSPSLVAWSPYGKHGLKNLGMMPGADVPADWVSKHAIWEGPDPEYWCPRGYSIISPDPRGAWSSEGTLTFWSRFEADDGYDLIEWLARQPWSTGKIGMLGVSYLAVSQWMIAARRPPSLAAICPWEGFSDAYRELYFHGGIPEQGFLHWWQPMSRWSLNPAEDVVRMHELHPLRDGYWKSKAIDLSAIEVPAFVVAGWGDHGLHTRGTLEGYKQISSKRKWLQVHGQKKWRHFYDPTSIAKQQAFFDHFLKGHDTAVSSWPAVTIETRENNESITSRSEPSWPPPSISPRRLFLDCGTMSLTKDPPLDLTQATYESTAQDGRVSFGHCFSEDTEITGGAALHIWMSAEAHVEMDVFIAFRKLDREGKEVGFRFFSTFSDGPVALGWLRASHRALAASSTLMQPVHAHDVTTPVQPGKAVALDIEIWPSSTLFRAGESLQVMVGGTDLYVFKSGAPENRHKTDNKGLHRILSGPGFESYLTLPVKGQPK